MNAAPVRPKDAAGLIVVREGKGGPEILLGKRHPKSRFMPSVYVFPGGRMAPSDRQHSGFRENFINPPQGIDKATKVSLSTFARTALRETFEETGMLIGGPSGKPAPGSEVNMPDNLEPVWQAYREAGMTPPFDHLKLVARAITPCYSPIRFHTRFFRIDCGQAVRAAASDGELVDVHWAPLDRIEQLPMSSVTLLVLEEALAHRPGRMAARFAWAGSGDRERFRRQPQSKIA